jgi:predicted S18 family serine protease
MVRKINEQLKSAKLRVRSLDEAQLPKELQTSLKAVYDFIQKAEDAVERGEYYQGLVLAQKANTLASTIATKP